MTRLAASFSGDRYDARTGVPAFQAGDVVFPLLHYPLSLLLVSDKDSYAKPFVNDLSGYGQLPSLATSLEEAVAVVTGKRISFDAILVDTGLAEGDAGPALSILAKHGSPRLLSPGMNNTVSLETMLLDIIEAKLSEPDMLDPSVLHNIFAGYEEDYQQALEVFRTQSLPEILELTAGIGNRLPVENRRMAHKLKSSAYVIGANKLGNILQCLDASLAKVDVAPVRLVEELDRSARAVRSLLSHAVKGG